MTLRRHQANRLNVVPNPQGNRPVQAGPTRVVSLERVHERVEQARARCHDLEVRARDITYLPNGCVSVAGDGGAVFGFTNWSFAQWCAKLKVPVLFMRASPEGDGPAGRKAIFDYWKEQIADKRLFLRVKDHETQDKETGATGRVRAVLTDRYSVFDNHDLLEMVSPLITKNGLVIAQANLTDESFHMRLLWPDEIAVGVKLDGTPDVYQYGVHAANSEVGFRNITGDTMVYRQVCSNGLIVLHNRAHLFYMRHIGLLRNEIRNGLERAFDEAEIRRMEVIDQVETAGASTFSGSPAEAVTRAQREIRAFLKANRGSEEFVDVALRAFEAEPIPSRLGVVQAITAAAKTLSVDLRLEMEEAAGRYLLAA